MAEGSSSPNMNIASASFVWLLRQPVRAALMFVMATCILTGVFWMQLDSYQTSNDALFHIKNDIIKYEITHEITTILTPAQQEFASNHLIAFILSIGAELSDQMFIWFSADPDSMAASSLFVYAAIVVAIRSSIVIFVMITAFPLTLCMVLWGRYYFNKVWAETQIADSSGTYFAMAWGTRGGIPWLIFIFLALPMTSYSLFTVVLLSWLSITGFIGGRTFTDHL